METISLIDALTHPTLTHIEQLDTAIKVRWEELARLEDAKKFLLAQMDGVPEESVEAEEDEDEQPKAKATPTAKAKANEAKPRTGKRRKFSEWRGEVGENLRLNGASQRSQIVATLGIAFSMLDKVLADPWFEQRDDKRWQLSATGKAEAPPL